MLAAIGETFETPYVSPSSDDAPAPATSTAPAPLPSSFSNEITGVIVSTRKAFFRLNIWTRSSSSSAPQGAADADDVERRIKNIGRHFKYGVLGFPEGGMGIAQNDKVSSDVEFQSHEDSQKRVRPFSLSLSLSLSSPCLVAPVAHSCSFLACSTGPRAAAGRPSGPSERIGSGDEGQSAGGREGGRARGGAARSMGGRRRLCLAFEFEFGSLGCVGTTRRRRRRRDLSVPYPSSLSLSRFSLSPLGLLAIATASACIHVVDLARASKTGQLLLPRADRSTLGPRPTALVLTLAQACALQRPLHPLLPSAADPATLEPVLAPRRCAVEPAELAPPGERHDDARQVVLAVQPARGDAIRGRSEVR